MIKTIIRTPVEALKEGHPFVIWLVLMAMISISYLIFGCGSVPFDPCTPDEVSEKRCSADKTEVQYCAGGYWHPSVRCDEITGPDGELVDSVCRRSQCEVAK